MSQRNNKNFAEYLRQFKKEPDQPQTHTWFSPTKFTTTLYVPHEKSEEFLEHVYNYITNTDAAILENPKRGENALTEKISRDVNKFRMYADIDFKVDLFEKHELPVEEDVLTSYMSDLVTIYDSVITEVYGADFICDRIVAKRLPYKLHIIYPSIVVNKQIAENICNRFIDRLKNDSRFTKTLTNNEQIVDKSVYATGLRMIGMHKSTMGKKGETTEKEWRAHENIFGENTYKHCYHLVDPATFEPIPLTFSLFKTSCIRVDPDETDYTSPLDEDLFSAMMKKNKGKGPARATRSVATRNQVAGSSSTSPAGVNAAGPSGSTNTALDLFSIDDEDFDGSTLTSQVLSNAIPATIKYLKRSYGRLFHDDKIKYQRFQDDDGGSYTSILFPLLDSTECMIQGRPHEGNRQYIVLDKHGARLKCHDDMCKGTDWKPVKPSRMPMAVKDELIRVRVLPEDVVLKKKPKEPTDEEKVVMINELVKGAAVHFPKNELKIEKNNIYFKDLAVFVGIQDLWCDVCQRKHEEPSSYMEISKAGYMTMRCVNNRGISAYTPDPALKLEEHEYKLFFPGSGGGLVRPNGTTYSDKTGDVSVDFTEEAIFQDEVLNHLVYESLASTTWPIVKVIHHLGKYHFNCTKSGEWYAFKGHKWLRDSESAFLFFISETVARYYRQVRDFYGENTESPELRQKRIVFIQRIIDRLTNVSSKMDFVKEAKTYFYEEDYYSLNDGYIHFEDRLDEKRNLLAFTNGVYDLDADIFRDGTPYDFITMTVGFDYNSVSEPAKRAELVSFFESMQPDEDEREYLLLFLSSLLHGGTYEETFHIMSGVASNGKSLLRDLIMHTLGDYFESIPANLLTKERPSSSSPQPEIVKLKGKRAVVASEPEQNQKINTGYLKMITGNDPIAARMLHSNNIVRFLPHFKLILLCNDIPVMDNNDIGTWRRARIKEFPVTFCDNPRPGNKYEKPIDRTLKERIMDCKQEFILYLMEWFRHYDRIGRTLKPTDRINRMIQKHKKKSNTVLQFIEEKTEPAQGHGILLVDLYQKYMSWMRQDNPGEQPLIKSKVIEELQRMRDVEYSKHVRVKTRKGGQQGIRNRRLIEEEPEDETGGAADGFEVLDNGAALNL